MKYSESIKPISYLKAHASELVRTISDKNETMIITLNGEAKVVVQDIKIYEQMQDSLALLKILAQSSKSIEDGEAIPAKDAFRNIRKRVVDGNI